jgi:hypothetical protein
MKRKLLFPIIIVCTMTIVYGYTLAPGLSWANGGADGGDLITAAFVNGVPHPTGYPLYMLIAKIFQMLPVSNLAFRTNLLSAFCTIMAAVLVFLTLSEVLEENRFGNFAAALAALLFGLSPLVWSQAVITEVYGLQSLLTIGILYQTVHKGISPYRDLLRGFLFGLALGNHVTTILLFPLLLIEYRELRLSSLSHILTRIFSLILGASIYLILPLRALNQPAINWMNPVTLKSFFQLITGSIYQSYFSVNYFFEHARAWAGFLIENLSFAGVALGIFTVLDNGKIFRFKILAGWIFLSYGLFALFYESYDSYVYLIQTILAFSLLIGIGFERIIDFVQERWQKVQWLIYPLLIIFFVSRISFVIPKVNAANDNRAEVFGTQVFDTVPEKAMVFTQDDPSTFALWYFHFAERKRPDTFVIAEGLLEFDWYRKTLQAIYPTLKIQDTDDLAPFHLQSQNPDLPSCFIGYTDTIEFNC